MVTSDRWRRAQEYEASCWARAAAGIAAGAGSDLAWYRWRAGQLVERLRALGLDDLLSGAARVLEVGSGPLGLVTFFPARHRVAVDPLAAFYARHRPLVALRDPAVSYQEGQGESLPSGDGAFDMVVIENCIDHVRDVHQVMRELRRVLRPDGVLYLTVNCRSRWGFLVHRVLSRLRIDAGHPHTFTPPRARRLVAAHGFTVLQAVALESWRRAWLADLRAQGLRPRLKAVLGVSEYPVAVFARRSADGASG